MKMDGSFPVWLSLFLCATYSIWLLLRRHFEKKVPFQGEIPCPPSSHWLLGHIRLFQADDFPFYLKRAMVNHANQEGLTAFFMGNKPTLSVLRWQDARMILRAESYRRNIPQVRRHFARFLGAQNIGTLNGREWKSHRSTILHALHPRAMLEGVQTATLEVTKTFLSSLREQRLYGKLDVAPLMKMITMDVFGRTAFTYDLKCCLMEGTSPVIEAFDFLGNEFTRRMANPLSVTDNFYAFPTESNLLHKEQQQVLRTFLTRLVKERRDLPKEQRPDDLLTSLLETNDGDAVGQLEGIKDHILTDMLMALLFGGYDTTSIALMYTLYNVATSPPSEALCVEEIQREWIGDSVSVENLQYCRAVVLESLRLYPPAFFTFRASTKPLQLSSGFVVPQGTLLLVPIWNIHHDPSYFPRPNEFHPERWVYREKKGMAWEERIDDCHENATGIPTANRDAFLPFSAGARSCAGEKFALNEAVLVLAALLRELKFSIQDGYEVQPYRNALLQRPKGGLPMNVQPRSLC